MSTAISMDMVKLVGAINIDKIISFTARAVANEHAYMSFKGVLDKENADKCVHGSLQGQEMYILCETDQTIESFFGGQILNASFLNKNGFNEIEVQCVSGSYNFDLIKMSRSFQNTQMTYREMFQEIKTKDQIGNIVDLKGSEEKLNYPIIQYQETDWEFAKRMASHFGTVVLPEITNGFPQISIGVVEGRSYAIESNAEYEMGKSLSKYRWKAGRNSVSQNDFIYYRIKDYRNFALGDKLRFQNRNLVVFGKEIKIVNSLLEVWYIAGEEQGFGLKQQYNRYISGMSIIGTVLDTTNEELKLHLDIDEQQDQATAYTYTWMPQTGNLMYCMPTIGTRVSLYFPSSNEGEAIATECVRTNGGNFCPEMNDYNVRQFLTDYQKRLTMERKNMRFVGSSEDNQNILEIEDSAAISFLSDKPINIVSKGEINIKAKKNVYIKAKKLIRASKTGVKSGIEIAGEEINVHARKIYQSGLQNAQTNLPTGQPAPSFPFGMFVGNVIGAAPAVAVPAAPAPANNVKTALMNQAMSGLSSALNSVTASMAPVVDKLTKKSEPKSSGIAGAVAALAAPLTMAKALLPPSVSMMVGAAGVAAVGVAAVAAKTASSVKTTSNSKAASAPSAAAKPLAPFSAAALTLPILGMATVGVGNMGGLSMAAVAAVLMAASKFFGVVTGSYLSIAKQTVAQMRESLLESVEPWKPSKKLPPNTGLSLPRDEQIVQKKPAKPKEPSKPEATVKPVAKTKTYLTLESMMWSVDGITITRDPKLYEQNKSNWCYATVSYLMCRDYIKPEIADEMKKFIEKREKEIQNAVQSGNLLNCFYNGTRNDEFDHLSKNGGLRGNFTGIAMYKGVSYQFCHPIQEFLVDHFKGDLTNNEFGSSPDVIEFLTNKILGYEGSSTIFIDWFHNNNTLDLNIIENSLTNRLKNGPVILTVASKANNKPREGSFHSVLCESMNGFGLSDGMSDDEKYAQYINAKLGINNTLDGIVESYSSTVSKMFIQGESVGGVSGTSFVTNITFFKN